MEAAYQLMVPAAAAACKVAVPVPHIEAPVVEVKVGSALTVATTAVRGADVHPLLVTST